MKSSSRVKGPPVMEPIRCLGSEPSPIEKKKVKNVRLSREHYEKYEIDLHTDVFFFFFL